MANKPPIVKSPAKTKVDLTHIDESTRFTGVDHKAIPVQECAGPLTPQEDLNAAALAATEETARQLEESATAPAEGGDSAPIASAEQVGDAAGEGQLPAPVALEDLVIPVKVKYRRTPGDRGQSTLRNCDAPIVKCDGTFSLIGAVEQLSACLGLARSHTRAKFLDGIPMVQAMLFEINEVVRDFAQTTKWIAAEDKVCWLQDQIDVVAKRAPDATRGFAYPGGHPVTASLHLALAACRNVERCSAAYFFEHEFGHTHPEGKHIQAFFNNLSILLEKVILRSYQSYDFPEEFWNPAVYIEAATIPIQEPGSRTE